MKTIGKKTTLIVMVTIVSGRITSLAPMSAASRGDTPNSKCRAVFSKTTIDSSMSKPITTAMPPSVMALSVCREKYKPISEPSTASGNAMSTMPVGRTLPRKMNTIAAASRKPSAASCTRLRMAWRT